MLAFVLTGFLNSSNLLTCAAVFVEDVAAVDKGVGAVLMNGFETFDTGRKPGNVRMIKGRQGDFSDHVLDEHGVVESGLGDIFFVGPFEQRVEFT